MILFRSFLLFSALVFAATPSAAQSSDSGTRATTSSTSPRSASSTSSTTTTTTTTPSPTSFGIITTTNSQGSTFVTSIPITIPLNTTSSATSSAPYPTLTGYPSCVTDCLTYAVAQANCTSITAVNCYCPSRVFPDALYTCVAGNCSTDVPSAENLAQQFCALDSVTVSFSSTAAPSPSSPSSPSASAATSASSTSSNAASASSWTSDTRGWAAMVAAACGALFGAALL
ncbi:hypothetical protein EDB85DRAFT_1203760 [Lactarius pseudohatsudake]|nr:hypothetical protein EDB85DRAFT_1203760 [Lactarius pseudohatsudake]